MAGKRMEKEGHNSAQFLNQPGAFHGRLGHGAMIAHGYAHSRLLWHLHLQIFCSGGHHLGCFKTNKYSETDSTDPNRFQQVKTGREFVPTFLGGHWPARATLLSEPICHMPSPNLVSTGINHDLAVVLSQNGKYKIIFSAGCCTLRTHFSAMCRFGSGWATGLIAFT